jgi:acyl-CoA synthetase (AMP-forming)/AMP-acid ligase II
VFFGEWFRTGDLARRDEACYVYLSDRAKFRIKTGGYNVFPTEIENLLAEHPAARIEQTIGKLKRFKRVAMRCERPTSATPPSSVLHAG